MPLTSIDHESGIGEEPHQSIGGKSLLHRQGRSWAEIARFVCQRTLSLTADTYRHVLADGRELDYAEDRT